MDQQEDTGITAFIRSRIIMLKNWIRPDPRDKILVQVLKLLLKSVVILILIALSPAIIVILLLVFMITL